ncbi:MAG: opacity protein-like surface antigen [Candidatus Latescibacterota bacterium]|jgi:opacity protein-like surface antigen
MKGHIMKRILLALTLALLVSSVASAQTGRTDGTEESEFGKGGYPFSGPASRFYLNTSFGSAFFKTPGLGNTQTGFLYGVDLGFEMDQWLGVQVGYTYLSDRDMSIFSLGSRFAYTYEPFIYHVSLSAGLYDPEIGSQNFGLAPGAGIDIKVNDRVRLGLDYKHDFIFTDNITTDIDRVYAGLKFFF